MPTAFAVVFPAAFVLCTTLAAEYREAFFDQRIDHFNFQSFGNRTFKQRYLYNDTWWDQERGPIFFYAGNEIPIDSGWTRSGFIADMAPSHGAFLLFVEHRYYGKSLPFGEDSFQLSKIGLLTVEQALADYAFFLADFRRRYSASNSPVIVIGTSYGGLLSTYMRFKYPNLIQGSYSSSAPVYQLEDKVSGDLYFEYVTKSFREASEGCESGVRAGFQQLDRWASKGGVYPVSEGRSFRMLPDMDDVTGKNTGETCDYHKPLTETFLTLTEPGLKHISKTFKLCSPMKSSSDYDRFLRWVRSAFGGLAIGNYHFPVNGYPGRPVQVACERLEAESSPALGLRSVVDLANNVSGDVGCYDLQKEFVYCSVAQGCSDNPVYKAWTYQTCTQINDEGDSNGVTDMFPALPFTPSMRDEYCKKKFNVTPRRDWLRVVYWGDDIALSSNIVFTNGAIDPWTPGGILTNVSESIRSYVIEGGAHHPELWSARPDDPQPLIDARNFIERNIRKWTQEFHDGKRSK